MLRKIREACKGNPSSSKLEVLTIRLRGWGGNHSRIAKSSLGVNLRRSKLMIPYLCESRRMLANKKLWFSRLG